MPHPVRDRLANVTALTTSEFAPALMSPCPEQVAWNSERRSVRALLSSFMVVQGRGVYLISSDYQEVQQKWQESNECSKFDAWVDPVSSH